MLVLDADFPDPHIVAVDGGWFAYSTQSGGRNVQVAHSADLRHWQLLGDALPELPGWARPGFTWSPAVLPREDHYLMYVALRPKQYERQAIAVLSGDRPEGPFTAAGRGPLIFQRLRGGSIDPDPYLDAHGVPHLLWKSDGELVGRPSILWSRRLSGDGLRLVGRGRRLLTRDLDWEGPLIEAPALWQTGGRRYLFYSAGTWRDDGYGIGYAVAGSVDAPFVKPPGPAWFAGGADAAGPGGQCVVTRPSGSSFLAYHAWSPDRVGYERGGARRLHIDLLTLDDRGAPRLTQRW